jgi:hypothetical protein
MTRWARFVSKAGLLSAGLICAAMASHAGPALATPVLAFEATGVSEANSRIPPVPPRKPRPEDVIEQVLAEAHGLQVAVDAGLRQDLLTLARNIYFEARGENLKGQIAVAFVTLNRVKSTYWPDSIDEVVYQPYQFSWTLHPTSIVDFEAFKKAARVGLLSLSGHLTDPTGGADHYYAPELVETPRWAHRLTKLAEIDGHVFFTASARAN